MIRLHARPRLAALIALALLAAPMAASADGAAQAGGFSLAFDPGAYAMKTATVDGATISYRAYEDIVYVRHPVDSKYERMNVYAPAQYYQGGKIGGYDAATAPIFLPNSIGGYMPGEAAKPGEGMDRMNGTIARALARGFVVAAPGARGRTLKGADGAYTGKAPAAIVDLKAAVRYLRYNDKAMPGNAERIVSNGTSAGGALSALLGAAGNDADYEPNLKALGAAEARDDIWAVSAYCPITNLENADASYEWLLGGLRETRDAPMTPPPGPGDGAPPVEAAPGGAAGPWGAPQSASGPLTEAQIALSARLKVLFPAYINGLGLKGADGAKLTLGAEGEGPFRDYVKSLLIASARLALKGGADLSALAWIQVKDGTVTDIEWAGYLQYCGRKKGVPAFDALDLSSGENNEFGTAAIGDQHFTAFGRENNSAAGAGSADPRLVLMMNPMGYIGKAGTSTARYWRIRHGTKDSDTALAIPAILAARLAAAGCAVDFALPWDRGHSGDYDLDELFDWIARVCR